MSKSTIFVRLLLLLLGCIPTTSSKYSVHPFVSACSPPNPIFTRNYSSDFRNLSLNARIAAVERAMDEIVAQAQRERMCEREERIKAGLSVADLDAEEEEAYLGVGPLIENLEKDNWKDNPALLNVYEDPTDSVSESEGEGAMDKQFHLSERKFEKHQQLLDKFAKAGL